mmetsp:Transcript_24802/g.30488  ORF Transcript_24802/g.30488 Transcript_24802/m.30488 type:complete len:202 (+) Transcript_24802:235-840(+)
MGDSSFVISCDEGKGSYLAVGERNLCCRGNGNISALSDEEKLENDHQVWNIELLSGELCFLSSPDLDRRLSCHPWGGKLSMSQNWDGWEVWRFIEAGNSHVRVSNWTHTNKYLCSNEDGTVWTADNQIGEWELWDVERGPEGSNGVVIKSVSHGRYLKAGTKGLPVSTCTEVLNEPLTVWQTDSGHCHSFYISSKLYDKRI